ncbi:MAG: alpha/beta hydrolase [Bacteroidia bacterium]|nr:alpha/beta hydrolase [Bacteroidia bacterium]
MNVDFKDPQFSFEFLRTIGYSSTGGADIGECLVTASRIEDGNTESWYTEWEKTASRLEKTADNFLAEGHEKSAMEAYFRASGYFRNAEFFLHGNPDDPRILDTWGKSRSCFQKAMKYTDTPIHFVRIPFGETTMPGCLCLADDSGGKRPLLIIHSGFDGTAEDLYFELARLALERGYNCLLFEGPGQGEMIRVQHIPFRPDWEHVITPVVDYAIELPEVDPERIGLIGISFGGYHAPRAVAFEKRIKVCVPNGGIYDFNENVLAKCPPGTEEMIHDKVLAQELDKEITAGITSGEIKGWVFENGMYTFGAKTPSEFLRMLEPYSLRDDAFRISCKMLVIDSENDDALPGQAKQLYDALSCPKEFMLFTAEEGADQHCQMGAVMISGERILNWLDDNL